MVAGIQAYVFTMFSSVYIGLATEDDTKKIIMLNFKINYYA